MKLNFDVPRELHLRLKRHAGILGKPLTVYLKEFLLGTHTDEAFEVLLLQEGCLKLKKDASKALRGV